MKKLAFVLVLLLSCSGLKAQVQGGGGFPPFGSFDAGLADTINRQNLNSNFSIPVYSGTGRGVGLGFNIAYNSLIWQNVSGSWKPVVTTGGTLTWGWNTTYVAGAIYYTSAITGYTYCTISGKEVRLPVTTYSGYTYTEPNGTLHAFPSLTWSTNCSGGSGSRSGYADDESGYYMSFPSGSPAAATAYDASGKIITNAEVKDTNGNYVSSTIVNSSETDWLDTLGRHALKITSSSSNIQYQYQDTTGTYRTITLTLGSFNVKTNFACSGVVEYSGTASLPTSVSYPNGTSYVITYEGTPGNSGYVTGRVSKLTLPDGGYVQYTYGTTNDGIDCSDSSVTNLTRTLYDGTNTYSWIFARAQNGSNWTTTVTYPQMPYDSAANQSVFTFNSGEEISAQIYQGSASGTLLRTINTTWASNYSPATKTIILEDNSTQSEQETTYDNYGNLQVLKEHDFGSGSPGPILRTTNWTYQTATAYTQLNILNLVLEKTIADASGTVQYREDTTYDGSSLSPCPTGVPQHDDTTYSCSFLTRANPTSFTTYTNASAPLGAETKTSSYDMFGNVVSAQVDCCQLIQRTYSASTEYSNPDTVIRGATGGPQLTTTYTYNSYTSQLASIKDPNNLVVSYAYDLVRRPTTVTRPDNSQITYTYNDSAHTVAATSPVDTADSGTTTQYLDGLGRTVKTAVTDASQNTYSIAQNLYDPLAREYQVSNPYTSSPQYWSTKQYDALGRKTKIILQDNSQTIYSYSAATGTTTDPAGHQRKIQSDGLGRLTTLFEPDPTNNNSLTLQTTYSYSVSNQVASVTQGSQTRSFAFDGMGRLTSEIHPESGTTSYQYNSFDKLTQRTDNRGVITTYQWDTLNRLQQVSYNVGTTGVPTTPTVTLTYGSTPSQYNNGLLISMTDGTGGTSYSYDNMLRKTQEAHLINGTSYPVSYQYNLAGEATSTTYPSTRVVQQGYDAIGRLASSTSGTTTYFGGMGYNAASEPTGFSFGNGVTASYAYTPDRLQLQSAGYANGATTLFGQSYAYGSSGANNGEITSTSDSVDSGRNMTYTYDSLDRLSTALSHGSTNYPQWGLSFTYDRYGNRTAQNVTAGTAPSNSVSVSGTTNQITSPGYAYDANGNMTNDGQNTIVYDAENRVVSDADGSGTATYQYDGWGRRVVKTFNGTTTNYILAGDDSVAEYANGTLNNEYVYSGTALIAEYNSGTLTYHGRDHLSIRLNMDTGGNDVGEHGHYPFGEDWYVTGTTAKWRFTNYERDSESGNDHATFRYHVNRLGRFLTIDPERPRHADPQLLNRYSYVGSDPIARRDPDGLFIIPCGIGWGIVSIYGFPNCGGGGLDLPCPYGDTFEGFETSGEGEPSQPICDPTPPPPPPPPQPECFALLRYRYATMGQYHAFWWIQDESGSDYTLSGGPKKTGKTPDHPYGYLHLWVVPGDVGHYQQDNPNASVWYYSGTNAGVCLNVDLMEAAADAFPNDTIFYYPNGPNSNSMANYLGQASSLDPTAPPNTTGWYVPLF